MEVYYYQLNRNTSKCSGPHSIFYIQKIQENHQIVITHYSFITKSLLQLLHTFEAVIESLLHQY